MNFISKVLSLFGIVKSDSPPDLKLEITNPIQLAANEPEYVTITELTNNNQIAESIQLEYPLLLKNKLNIDCSYVQKNTVAKGVLEDFFYDYLVRTIPDLTTNRISINLEGILFTPDLAIIDSTNNVFIAIEIDEPYTIANNGHLIPIHISNSDNVRNQKFINNGWSVIRFAEEQIAKYPEKCSEYVKAIFQNTSIPPLPPIKQWSTDDAMTMIKDKHRDSYLPFAFREANKAKMPFASSYRSFIITSISRGFGKREGHITFKLDYPRYKTSDGEKINIVHHPQQCLIIESDFWDEFSKQILGCTLDNEKLEVFKLFLQIRFVSNLKNRDTKLEGFGQANGLFFNLASKKFTISLSKQFVNECRKILDIE